MNVVDADGHVFEPDALWDEHLSGEYRERRPRLVRDNRGTTRYMIEGRLIPAPEGRGAWTPEGIQEASLKRPGGIDPKARLVDMDAEGIDVAVLYGTIGMALWRTDDRDFGVALCRAYNDWLAAYCAVDARRLKAVAAVPLQHPAKALEEAERAVRELGAVAVVLPCWPLGRNPDSPALHPIYELAQDLDVPVAFHAGGGLAADRFVDAYAMAHVCSFAFDAMFALSCVLGGGVLERFPTLRVGVLEAGCGWLPYWLERIDEHVEKRPSEFPAISRLPSETFAEGRCFVSCEPDEVGLPFVVDALGPGSILYASDYPHWDATFPGSVAALAGRDDLTDEAKRAILADNARRFMRLDDGG